MPVESTIAHGDHPQIEQYTCDHLFLLIGRNPLPNYVAAKLLAKTSAKNGKAYLYLVHSKDNERDDGTRDYADNLMKVLGNEKFHPEFLPVEPSSPTSVATEICKHLSGIPANETVGLNYTGGTKAMAVHAYDTIRRWKEKENEGKNLENKRKVYFSYLDPRRLALCIDPDGPSKSPPLFELGRRDLPKLEPLFDAASISLEQLLRLHGLERWQNVGAKWRSTPSDENAAKQMAVNVEDYINNCRVTGSVFEDYVLQQALELKLESKDECSLSDVGMNLEVGLPSRPQNQFFEIDVVAMRGYQLFAISCTLDVETEKDDAGNKIGESGLAKVKKKLFEIKLRAQQLGGDEAQVALVCPMGKPSQGKDGAENLKLLKGQLKDSNIEVFGYCDLPNLKDELGKWFKGER